MRQFAAMEFRLLGPLVVASGGMDLAPTRPKQRALLTYLLLHAGEPVSVDELVEALWHPDPPATAVTALHGHISALRKRLGPERIRTRAPGYLLKLDPADDVDARRFERLLAGAAHQEPDERAQTLGAALELFTGPPLVEVRYQPFAEAEVRRLEELRLAALEQRAEALLEAADHRAALPELQQLVREHPLRERARTLLMLALYRSGRQGDALQVAQEARVVLAEELGVDPGPALLDLERRILNHDPRLAAPAPASAAGPGEAVRSPQPRGLVTFLAMADASAATLSRLTPIVERHGALLVEPAGHETIVYGFARVRDASQAAVAVARQVAARLGEAPRVGLHTAEVVARDPAYSAQGARSAVHVAVAAQPGQVLLSRASRDLLLESSEADVALEDLGEHRLQDLGPGQRLFQLVAPGAARDFASPRSLDRLPNNLPLQLGPLVGREREIRDVLRLLSDTPAWVTLTGPGGTGKTRLALHVAAEALPRFPGGVHLVELAPLRDPGLVLPTLAAALGVRDAASGDQIIEQAHRHVRTPTLLAVDNFEHLLPARHGLEGLLAACPPLSALVTSRPPLGTRGERVYEVPPLSAPPDSADPSLVLAAESAALFSARARQARADFAVRPDNARSVATICRRLDGLPLAIELAAARVSMLAPNELAARLDAGLGVLSAGTARGERHRTLEAAIAWSHELLEPEASALFRRASVFSGGWSLEAVEAVCDGGGVLDTLSALVDQSLVRTVGSDAGPRFDMLATIREFAAARLEEAGEAAAYRDRHADHLLDLAEGAEPHLRGSPGEWLPRLETEHDNLRAALDHLAAAGDTGRETRLAGALWRFWYLAGHLSEGRRRIELALARPSPGHDPARGKALLGAAVMAVNTGDVAAALARSQEALDLHEALGDQWGAAYARFMLAAARRGNGEPGLARDLNERALAELRELGDEHTALLVARNLASTYEELGDATRARALHEESLRRARLTDNHRLQASTLGALAMFAFEEGRLQDARWLLTESLRIHRFLGDHLDTAVDVSRAAHVLALAREPEIATRVVSSLGTSDREIGARGSAVAELNRETLAAVRRQLGEEAFAEAWRAGEALNLAEALLLALEGLEDRSRLGR